MSKGIELDARIGFVDTQRLESRVQAIAEACVGGGLVEDDRVELKSEWPTNAHKTARQIAAHANASRGEPILWVIGLDERRQRVVDVEDVEVANWWPPVEKVFDGLAPSLRMLVVPVGESRRVVALEFDTSRGPYVVATEGNNSVTHEVPWRAGNRTRSARRHELLRSLVEEAQAPELELVDGALAAVEVEPDSYSGEPKAMTFAVKGELRIYVSALDPVMLPAHRQSWIVRASGLSDKSMWVNVNPPYRLGRYTQSGVRAKEPVGHIEVLGNRGMFVHRAGEIEASLSASITEVEAAALRVAPYLDLQVVLPVDRSSKAARLDCQLSHVPGSDEPKRDDGYRSDRTRARFEPGQR